MPRFKHPGLVQNFSPASHLLIHPPRATPTLHSCLMADPAPRPTKKIRKALAHRKRGKALKEALIKPLPDHLEENNDFIPLPPDDDEDDVTQKKASGKRKLEANDETERSSTNTKKRKLTGKAGSEKKGKEEQPPPKYILFIGELFSVTLSLALIQCLQGISPTRRHEKQSRNILQRLVGHPRCGS